VNITIELTPQEVGLLRAGLAAHRGVLANYATQTPAEKEMVWSQRNAAGDLSDKLGTAMIEANK